MREAQSHERTCIVTRRQDAPEGMIRFVRAPDGAVAPDIRSRLPGRGVWVTARADLVAEAARKQAFSRGLKAKAEAAATLADDVDALLEADCLQMLALANKAGLVITGFGKVATALEKGEARVLIEAINGGEDGRRKIGQCARRGEAATRTARENRHNIYVKPIGFGVGPHKCDTCCARGGRTFGGLSVAVREIDPLPGRGYSEFVGARRR